MKMKKKEDTEYERVC